MNRRSFLAGILSAPLLPDVLRPSFFSRVVSRSIVIVRSIKGVRVDDIIIDDPYPYPDSTPTRR